MRWNNWAMYSLIWINIKLNTMNRIIITLTFISAVAFTSTAQTASIATGLGLYVFPANGQSQETMDNDEIACYKWAKEQTGIDPINPPQVQAAQVDRSPDGSMVVGGAKGAAAGAAIGAIAGDAGKGAAIGAVAGGLAGRRAKKYGDAVEQQQNNQEAAATEKAMKDSFNKADSSQASDDLKELLKALSIEVGKMAEQMPKEQAEQVAASTMEDLAQQLVGGGAAGS